MTGKLRKNACKNAYLGSIFIPEKYVIRVLFVSPWTSLIPPLPFECPRIPAQVNRGHIFREKTPKHGSITPKKNVQNGYIFQEQSLKMGTFSCENDP